MTTTSVANPVGGPDRTAESPGAARLAWRPVGAVCLAVMTFHMATSAWYGLHRDEFYYLAAGNHPAWGYVDQPPVTPMLYRLSQALFGDSIVGLHVLPALFGGALVLTGALLARELGGRRWAQVLTAVVAALGPVYLGTGRFLSTVTVDLLVWSVATLLVLRILRTGDTSLWVAVGGVVGVGLLNKYTVAFWIVGMAVGLLATPARRVIASGWLVVGAIVAAVLVAPNVAWLAGHDWASLHFMANLRRRTMGQNLTQYLPLQLALATFAGVAVWVAGLRWTLGRTEGGRYRSLGIAFVTVLALVLASGGKGYYAAPMYLPVVAAGSVAVERRWHEKARRWLVTGVVATGLLGAPVVTPILPEAALRTVPLQKVNHDLGGMLGWHGVAVQLAAVDHSLSPAARATAVILTSSYSEAGAVDYWRSSLDLPPAISGHNNYWWWGWNRAGDGPIITIGLPASELGRYFSDVQAAGQTPGSGALLDFEEQDAPIFVCWHPRLTWARLWPLLRDYT